MDLNTFKKECGHMHCAFCKAEINIDSATVTFLYSPNVAKIAQTMKGIETFELMNKSVFCSGRCLILEMLDVVEKGSAEGVFDPKAGLPAMVLKLFMSLETSEDMKRRKETLDAQLRKHGL